MYKNTHVKKTLRICSFPQKSSFYFVGHVSLFQLKINRPAHFQGWRKVELIDEHMERIRKHAHYRSRTTLQIFEQFNHTPGISAPSQSLIGNRPTGIFSYSDTQYMVGTEPVDR
jgi:hypothetical protein